MEIKAVEILSEHVDRNWAAVLAYGAALVLLGLFMMLCYEGWALSHGKAPITWLVRAQVAGRPHLAMILTLLIGALLGHFYWH